MLSLVRSKAKIWILFNCCSRNSIIGLSPARVSYIKLIMLSFPGKSVWRKSKEISLKFKRYSLCLRKHIFAKQDKKTMYTFNILKNKAILQSKLIQLLSILSEWSAICLSIWAGFEICHYISFKPYIGGEWLFSNGWIDVKITPGSIFMLEIQTMRIAIALEFMTLFSKTRIFSGSLDWVNISGCNSKEILW